MVHTDVHPESGMTRGKVLAIIVLVLVLFFGWLFYSQYRDRVAKSPKTAGNTFAAALVAKDSGASYSMLTEPFKQATPEDDWKAWVTFAFEGDNGTYKFVEELTVNEPDKTYTAGSQPTRYTYEFTLGDTTFRSSFVLVKENQVWKISEVGSFEE